MIEVIPNLGSLSPADFQKAVTNQLRRIVIEVNKSHPWKLHHRTITADLVIEEEGLIFINAVNNDIDLYLPPAIAALNKNYDLKRIDSSSYIVTINTVDSSTIDGQSTLTLCQWDSASIATDGENFFII